MDPSFSTLPAVRRVERPGGCFTIDQSTSLDTRGFTPLEQARIERLLRFLPFNLDRTAGASTDESGRGGRLSSFRKGCEGSGSLIPTIDGKFRVGGVAVFIAIVGSSPRLGSQ